MIKKNNIKTRYVNWGPYLMQTKLPDYIIKRLLIDGDKLRKADI